MIDPSGILGVLLSLSDEWRNANVIQIWPLDDIEKEPAYQRITEAGHEVHWVADHRLRAANRDGWQPVTERDRLGRPSVFMDRNNELLLMYR